MSSSTVILPELIECFEIPTMFVYSSLISPLFGIE